MGRWTATFGTACNLSGAIDLDVAQQGCLVSFDVPGVGMFQASLGDPSTESRNARVALAPSCGGSTIGRVQFNPDGSFVVLYGDGDPCCRHGAVTLRR